MFWVGPTNHQGNSLFWHQLWYCIIKYKLSKYFESLICVFVKILKLLNSVDSCIFGLVHFVFSHLTILLLGLFPCIKILMYLLFWFAYVTILCTAHHGTWSQFPVVIFILSTWCHIFFMILVIYCLALYGR
jgi:hypothetical protein